MPSSYYKAEDPCVDNLNQSNKQRETEIHSNQKAVDKLKRQIATSGETLQEARKLREDSQQELNRIRKKRKVGKGEQLDPALAPADAGLPATGPHFATVGSTCSDYTRAPRGTMSDLLNRLS